MPDVESMEILGDATSRSPGAGPGAGPEDGRRGLRPVPSIGHRRRVVGLAVAALAGALVAVGVMVIAGGGFGSAPARPPGSASPQRAAVTPAEQAAVAAVLAWAQALDRHDAAALDAVTVPYAGVVIVAPEGVTEGPFEGRQFLERGHLAYPADLRFEVVSRPQAGSERQVTLTGRLSYGGRSWVEQMVVNLEWRDTGAKVAAVVMTTVPTDD